jgi:hypothetical protein
MFKRRLKFQKLLALCPIWRDKYRIATHDSEQLEVFLILDHHYDTRKVSALSSMTVTTGIPVGSKEYHSKKQIFIIIFMET